MGNFEVFSENVLVCFLQGSTKMHRPDNALSVQNFNWLQQMCLNQFELVTKFQVKSQHSGSKAIFLCC